ncbi:MAG: TolC family protein [Kaiparowitsia implicata GSE-PSE-MK54-09C]|jgi:OMF family outer membrane factor|nr:TolC family protein [Kaiparowitsia implicata GSE-PSE-MK54-09C]
MPSPQSFATVGLGVMLSCGMVPALPAVAIAVPEAMSPSAGQTRVTYNTRHGLSLASRSEMQAVSRSDTATLNTQSMAVSLRLMSQVEVDHTSLVSEVKAAPQPRYARYNRPPMPGEEVAAEDDALSLAGDRSTAAPAATATDTAPDAPAPLAQLPTVEPGSPSPDGVDADLEGDNLDTETDSTETDSPDLDPPEVPDDPDLAPVVPPMIDAPSGAEVPTPAVLEPDPDPLFSPTLPEEVQVLNNEAISLEQAIALAQRNNRQVQTARLELDRSRATLQEAEAARLPRVNAQGSLTFQEATETQPFTGETTSNGLASSLGGNVQANYDLFTSGQRSASIRAAEGQVQLQELQVESLTEQLRLDVSTDYYDLQQADEQVRIGQDALAQAEQSLRDAQALERAGVGTRFDVLQAEVDVANSSQELTQAISNQQIARRQLAQRLGISQTASITAADPIDVAEEWPLTLEESIVLAYSNRAELEQQLVQREISEQRRRAAIANLGPQVGLFAQYSVNNRLDQDDTGFRDDYQFGAQVNLNLFDGGASRARARQEEINIEIAETDFANTRDTVRFQIEQAFLSLEANRDNIVTTRLGVDQAREALRLARLRFQAGVGTQTDVLRAQTELTRAEVNQVNAILGYNRSLVSLQRAVSNLSGDILTETP